jgi:hypothetical protein
VKATGLTPRSLPRRLHARRDANDITGGDPGFEPTIDYVVKIPASPSRNFPGAETT